MLSITASGDRPLHLLLDDCHEVVAIDANPIQNYLLNLKCVAMQTLDYDDYIAFLGALPHSHRLNTFQKLTPLLDEQARKYWMGKKKMIHKGILYQGLLEKRCQSIFAPFIQMLRGKNVKRLFEFSNIDEQREFIKSWDKKYWRKTFDIVLNSSIARLILRCVVDDPCLGEHLNGSVSLGTYFYKRMHEGLMENLARESLLFSLFFKGKIDREAFPPYLTERGVSIIKERIHRITVKNSDIVTYLESEPSNSFDCFSLSDVASYLSPQNFLKMMREVQRVAKPCAFFHPSISFKS